MSSQHPRPPKKSLMHNLGEFFGHIAQGVASDPDATKLSETLEKQAPASPPPLPPAGVVRQQTREQHVQTPEGTLILRRTIIDEVRRADEMP